MERYQILNGHLQKVEPGDCTDGNLCVFTPEELQHADRKILPYTVEECRSGGPAKLESYDGYDFILLNSADEKDPYRLHRFGVYLLPGKLYVVVREDDAHIKKILSLFLEGHVSISSTEKFLYLLLLSLIEGGFEQMEAISENVSHLEDQVLTEADKDCLRKIVFLRKKLMFYKKYYEQLQDVADRITENDNGLIASKSMRYFKIFRARTERLSRYVENLREAITQVREAYQSQVDIRLNNIMKIFTVVTSVCLPLTLISGWYGMNFVNMPELHWRYGYLYVIGLAAVVVTGLIAYCKKKKIL